MRDNYADVCDEDVWHEYEAEKAAWLAANPGATREEFEQAIREIVERMGL